MKCCNTKDVLVSKIHTPIKRPSVRIIMHCDLDKYLVERPLAISYRSHCQTYLWLELCLIRCKASVRSLLTFALWLGFVFLFDERLDCSKVLRVMMFNQSH